MPVTALIVDDSALSRQLISHYLSEAGCTVVGEAQNALQGLRLFRKIRPSLVTLDLMMPKVFDVDTMAVLRAMKREMPEVAIVVISVVPFERTQHDFLEHGVLAYVVKPLNDFSFEPVRRKLLQTFPELAVAHPHA